jgi:DNA-binding winged helix-turn-helix (wHTH) protein
MPNRTGADVRMTDRHDGTETAELNFGPFRLIVARKQQLREGKPVRIGQRALDVPIALARRPGEVIERRKLLSTVWQGTHVDECNLRAQIVAVRKALGDGINGKAH